MNSVRTKPLRGPDIVFRTLSRPGMRDSFGNPWQYHSRSDRHSKLACWCMLFDLLLESPVLVGNVARGLVGFGLNHEMRDFRTGRTTVSVR